MASLVFAQRKLGFRPKYTAKKNRTINRTILFLVVIRKPSIAKSLFLRYFIEH